MSDPAGDPALRAAAGTHGRTYFDEDGWRLLTEQVAGDPRCPRWLVSALGPLGRLASRLPVTEGPVEDSRFDMIYPH